MTESLPARAGAGSGSPEQILTLLEEVSEAIPRVLRRHLDVVSAIAVARDREPDVPVFDRDVLRDEALSLAATAADAASRGEDGDALIRRGLRRLKYRVVGALILEDLVGGPAAVPAVTATLSDLADALLDGALDYAQRQLASRHGRPSWGESGGFVVIAMGKLGGRELNYSSDIDLIFVVEHLDGLTDGASPVSVSQYADRLGSAVANILSERTEDGFCFRVDLLLRPDGRAGPPTSSLASAEQYYLCWGRTWERAAWLKARPCAGDLSVGAQLMERLRPFRYRRSLDYGMLEDIGAMRDRIAAAARADHLRLDLKKGPGGIRELEFLVQAQQLIWAGRRPAVRASGTLDAITRLAENNLLPQGAEADSLSEAYVFLRALEHRIQWNQEAQTQRLPGDDDENAWRRLARSFGLDGEDGPSRLRQRLESSRNVVDSAWKGLMSGREGSAGRSQLSTSVGTDGPPPRYTAALDPFATPDERRSDLESLGFADVDDAERRLADMARLGESRRMSEVAWRRFEQVAPTLLQMASESAAPNAALARIEAFVSRAGARATTYALLKENPAVMDTLVRLFASSAFLSERLISHPELLDALVLRGQGGERPPQGVEVLWKDLETELASRSDEDGALSSLRTLHTVELLRIGLSDLSGALPEPGTPHSWLSDLARVCVRGAHLVATTALRDRYGPLVEGHESAEPDPLAVVGMGSLGSGWMTYGSDLDLVFLYSASEGPPAGASDGRIHPRVWANRWSQRLITALTVLTREGRCYDVDMRLRPDGSAGQVVVPLAGFRAYYRDRARPWEHIALCRSSVVAAPDVEFGSAVEDLLVELRHLGTEAGPAVVAEARHMRGRQRAELKPKGPGCYDLKIGNGGLADVEFAVACVQVSRPRSHPVCRIADPLAAIDCLAADGWIDQQLADDLCSGYRFVRSVESQLRLRSGRGSDLLVFPSQESEVLARALNIASPSELERLVVDCRERLQAATAHVLDAVEAGR